MIDELQRIELYKQLNPNELSDEELQKIKKEIKDPKPETMSDEYFDFKLWYTGNLSRQESFANFLTKKITKKEKAKILEVGAGRTARLSRLLEEKEFEMTCMDPKLEIKNMEHIRVRREQFHYQKIDLSEYDYVIAQEPCEATEHVVRACTEQNTPFMMTLCGVPHTLISGQKLKNVQEWYDYLLNIAINDIKLRYVKLTPFLPTPMLKSNQF